MSIMVRSSDLFFFKQKTAYEMRISDWSSDVCSSDLSFGWSDRGGTPWKFSLIPLGGYVKMFGDANAASMPAEDAGGMSEAERAVAFPHKRLGQRAAIVAAGPIANFIFAIVVLAGLFSILGQPFTPAVVGEVVPGSAHV